MQRLLWASDACGSRMVKSLHFMNPSHLTIMLFAGVAELAGQRELTLPWAGGSAAELRSHLQQQVPAAAALLARCAVAVGERYCRDEDPVPPGADVAVIPPVSGG